MAYWIDPLGAMLLATYITWNWGNTAIENIKALVGLSATPEFLQKLTFLCFNHHSEVMKIDTVRFLTTVKTGTPHSDLTHRPLHTQRGLAHHHHAQLPPGGSTGLAGVCPHAQPGLSHPWGATS